MGSSGFVISDNPSPAAGGFIISDSPTPTATRSAQSNNQPGFWSTLGSDFMGGIPHTLANVGRLTGIGQTKDSFNQAAHELYQQFGPAVAAQGDEFQQTTTPQQYANAARAAQIRAGKFTGPLTPEEQRQRSTGGLTALPPSPETEPYPWGEMAAHMVSPYATDAAMLGLGEALGDVPWGKVGAVAKGAANGAGRGAAEMVPVSHGMLPRILGLPEVRLPAPLAYGISGGTLGAGAGRVFGEPGVGSTIGATTGAVTPIVRGAIKGGREAAAEYAARGSHLPRPDYSDLLTMPGAGVPVYSSTTLPEPGAIARKAGARPVVTRSPELPSAPLPRSSVVVDWLGNPVTPSNAEVPNPSSYVATPSSGRLVEPWKPTTTVTIDNADGQVGAPSGLLQNLMKTVQESPDKNAETIAEHAGNIGHQLTTNKNAVIAQHLLGQGLDAGKWDALSMEEKNAWVKKVNAAQKTKYKPFGADFGPGRYGRPAEEGVRQVSDALRVLGTQPPQ